MRIPILFCWFVILLGVFAAKRRKAERHGEDSERAFWERENAANAVRKQDISNLDYVDLSGVTLPFALFPDEYLTQCEREVMDLKEKRILNLTGISNTDLKMQYGAANLTALTQYDQNFTRLVRTLNAWGHRLHELSHTQEAITVLAFAISIGSDIKATYQLLAELYQQEGDFQKIKALIPQARTLNSLMKEPILSMLEQFSEST
ncbi:hypothetical protein AALC25_07680 [Lachnospiraceae bacterium 29-84]